MHKSALHTQKCKMITSQRPVLCALFITFPPPSQYRFVTLSVTKNCALQRSTSHSVLIYLSVNAERPLSSKTLANMCRTPANAQSCQPASPPSPLSCNSPDKMSPQPLISCTLQEPSQRLCIPSPPCGSIRTSGNADAQPTHICRTVPIELREECEPLTLQIPVCYLSPCYTHSVCRLQAAAAAAATVALCAVLSVGFHHGHSACAVKCSTVVSAGSKKARKKAEEDSRARDDWECEFCGTECFCWRYGD